MNAETEMATADGLGSAAPNAEDAQRMREWIADSGLIYRELGYEHALDLLGDTPDQQIARFIERHYEGGLAVFLRG